MFEHAVDKDDHMKNKEKNDEELSPITDEGQKKRKIDSVVSSRNTDNGNDDDFDNKPPNEKKPRAT